MANGDFSWQVQIGPNFNAAVQGIVNGTAATFYVAPNGDRIQAACSTTAGSSWQQIPPDQPFSVSGDNIVQWVFEVVEGGNAKFLIGNVGSAGARRKVPLPPKAG
jgi:hypothetical protein